MVDRGGASNSVHPLSCAGRLRVRRLVEAGEPEPPPVGLLRRIALEIHGHCRYRLLKAHRLAWGWTVEQAVERLLAVARAQGLGERGLTVRSWTQWEAPRGGRRPSGEYQDLLCRLFRTGPVQLGLAADYTEPHEGAARGPDAGVVPAATGDAGLLPLPVPEDAPVRFVPGAGMLGQQSKPPGKDRNVERRRLLAHAAAVTVGAVAFDINHWQALATADTLLPARLGAAEAEQVEALTAALRGMDYQHGGGICRELAVSQLDRARQLLTVPCDEGLQRRLQLAVADLHNLVGWTNFDVGAHGAAQEHFTQALELARHAGDDTLVTDVLYSMGRVPLHEGRAGEALRFFQLAQIAAQDSGSSLAVALVCANEAWAYGMLGNATQARRSVGRAWDELARSDGPVPPWLGFFDEADLHAMTGITHDALAVHDPAHASTAVAELELSLAARSQVMQRSRVFDLIALAANHLRQGDVDHGTVVAGQALDQVGALRSSRALDRLAPLRATAVTRGSSDDARVVVERVDALRAT